MYMATVTGSVTSKLTLMLWLVVSFFEWVSRLFWCVRHTSMFVVGRPSIQRSCRRICRQLDWRRPTWWNLAVVRVEFRAKRQCLRRFMCVSLVWTTLLEELYLTSHRSGQVAHNKCRQVTASVRQRSLLLLSHHLRPFTGKHRQFARLSLWLSCTAKLLQVIAVSQRWSQRHNFQSQGLNL